MSFVFPPPPPTANTLDSDERSHLVKSAKKIGKLLGTGAPHIVDDSASRRSSYRISLPISIVTDNAAYSNPYNIKGDDIVDGALKVPTSSHSPTSSISGASTTSTVASSSSRACSPATLSESPNRSSIKHKIKRRPVPPYLELSPTDERPASPFPLETIPASPEFVPSPKDTAFGAVPLTPNSKRRESLLKLQQKLGEVIPLDLLTSSGKTYGGNATTPKTSKSIYDDLPPLPEERDLPKTPGGRTFLGISRPFFSVEKAEDDAPTFDFTGSRRRIMEQKQKQQADRSSRRASRVTGEAL